jgi:methyl-accepting chemotaxis protein
MISPTNQRPKILYLTVALAIILLIALSVVLYGAISDAAKGSVNAPTQAAAATGAKAIQSTIANDAQLAVALAGQAGIGPVVQGKADKATTRSVEASILNFQKADPQIGAIYLYNAHGGYALGLAHDTQRLLVGTPGAVCDKNNFCTLTAAPAQGYTTTGQMKGNLTKTLQAGAQAIETLVFGRTASPYGDLFIFQPIVTTGQAAPIGVLVERIDASSIFSPYIQSGTSGSIIIDQNVAIGPGIVGAHTQGLLPVTQVLPNLDPAFTGDLKQITGLVPTPANPSPGDGNLHFTVNGSDVLGSASAVGMSNLIVVSYTAPGTISAGATRLIIAAGVFLLLLVLLIIWVYRAQNRQVRRSEAEAGSAIRAKSDSLTEDIIAVSQALAAAREGDLTVEMPASESEVGLLSLSLNGLISDYGQIVGGIVQTSKAVQEGAARVDEGVRRIVDAATNQAEQVALVAASVEDVATSAIEVQQGTQTATTLAGHARQAVRSGQESVGRIADAVDAIKEAAIGTTREFKRLQEDSIRLTALVASVKSNAENLDMQAANATLEARHLGTESGSAFATNIGRLARQAQDTLADAEGAVRSVVTSIDEVNRRIERISEQVRRGVEEVRTVRATFDEVTNTNGSLVQFIDSVADAAGIQSQSAVQAAQSISQIAQVFERFTEQLVVSGDEIANMRLVVAGLRESVADLKVGEAEPNLERHVSTESAA